MSGKDNSGNVVTVPCGVGNAVGVEKRHWFIAMVNNNTEKSSAEKLSQLGVDYYLPVQTEQRSWKNGRKAVVERVVIPMTLFIHCTEKQRREIVGLPFINRFMTDRASNSSGFGGRHLAVIPQNQIDRLKFMLGKSDTPVSITQRPLIAGDRVRVVRGSLIGLEGEVMDMKSAKSELIVRMDIFGCARLSIDTVNLELIEGR